MASERVDSLAGSSPDRYPSRETFFGCCASVVTPTASNTTATRIDGTAAFFIAHLVSSVMYHADRDKGKCDLRAKGDRVSSSGKTRFSLRLNCTTRQSCLVGLSHRRSLNGTTLSTLYRLVFVKFVVVSQK